MSYSSISTECEYGCPCTGSFIQSNLKEDLFYRFPGHPLVYYAQVPAPYNAQQRSQEKKSSPNCFVKAFRWYTQEHNVHKRTESVKIEDSAGFAAWLDHKYSQFLQDKQEVHTPVRAEQTDQQEAFGNISSVRIHTKRTFNPWKRRRCAANSRDEGDGCKKCKQSLETILPPKDMSRPASECTFQVRVATCCDSSKHTATSSDTQIISYSRQKSVANDVNKKNMRVSHYSKSIIGDPEIHETSVQIEFLSSPCDPLSEPRELPEETKNQTETQENPSNSPRHNHDECKCSEKDVPISDTCTQYNQIKEEYERTEISTQYNESGQKNETSETNTQNSEIKIKNVILSSGRVSSITEIKPIGRKSIECECPKDRVTINTGTEYIEPTSTSISTLPPCAVCHACPLGTAANDGEQGKKKTECPKDQVKINIGTEYIDPYPTSISTFPTCAVCHTCPLRTAGNDSEKQGEEVFERPKDQGKINIGTECIEPVPISNSTLQTYTVRHGCPLETADNSEPEKKKFEYPKDQVKFTTGTEYIKPAPTSSSTLLTCTVCHACRLAGITNNDSELRKEKLSSQPLSGFHDRENGFQRIKCTCKFKKMDVDQMRKIPVNAFGYCVEKNAQTSDHAIALANVGLCKCPLLVRVVVPDKDREKCSSLCIRI